MEYELSLTDLIDMDTLQRIQDAFWDMTGITAITTDANGVIMAQGSHCSDFCMEYTRKSPLGCKRCQECDKHGAEMALKEGASIVYTCHAGLMNFSAPIVVQDELVGCFIGCQVILEPPNPDKLKAYAIEIGVDPDEYLAAAQKMNMVTRHDLDNAAKFLYVLSDILSSITYNRYLVFHANLELGQTVKMRSDFLANMSHEIRTPMNAVIGMAEMALREELPAAARGYINQIKVAGNSLLTIINDILDFSKIEAGKMDIIPTAYESMSILNDVANIVMTRLKDKDVELILDIPPDLPYKLMGDAIRIKQIILNLANNAAKFTYQGKILMKMEYVYLDDEEIELHISVEDTGIGIKEKDLDKLFQSFSQVDSKRNRNIEGTGLGLAISKQLLTLMRGSISVASEYEKGSKFSCVLPQKIVDATPSVTIKAPESVIVFIMISNPYLRENLKMDLEKLNVEYREIESENDSIVIPEGKKAFAFIEECMFSASVEEFIRDHPQHTIVLIVGFYSNATYDIPNFLVIKKPLFLLTIARILNQEDLQMKTEDIDEPTFDFIAPDAEILIVDDNAINLTVAEGLLEPLKMKVDTALSGKEAIGKISVHHYDLIFMDHMMPDVDGVETTHIIRRFHTEYNDVPIIALTANAVDGTKEMFCQEGMNDFVAKPIELRLLLSKIRQWLPVEKIQRVLEPQTIMTKPPENMDITIGDLDVAQAMKLLGSENLFWTVLKDFYKVIEKKTELIKSQEEQEDWTNYTIEVHALKSAAKQIGALSLSDKAAAMEKAGNARDSKLIHECTDELLQQYMDYIPVLQPFCEDEKKTSEKALTTESLLQFFADMRTAIDDLDMDFMEKIITKMDEYYYKGWQQETFQQLKDAVEEVDVDRCESILNDWEGKL